jgi:hypothetical protein
LILNFLVICRLKKLSKKSDRWLGGKHTLTGGATGGRGDADVTIVDGYTLDVCNYLLTIR